MARNKLVYICSPYRGDIEQNTKNARAYSFEAMILHPDVLPIAPHLLFTQYLNDEDPEQRRIGLNAGLDLLSICDELWVYGLDNPSDGMKAEIELAKELSIPIRDGFKPDDYDEEYESARFGDVTITVPGTSVYAEDTGILYAGGPQQITLEADTVFAMARMLRLQPGKKIDLVISTEGTEARS